ncbi:unnamed protein product [Rotaria magnacalcarata]|uniref:Uncharacterized protein n=1 Tax=Rotaria magnacalcarata TaxID=392030 RepID=A0A815A615_9BILA|nr:unnamed protein product [Rotaria magnacalcarata]
MATSQPSSRNISNKENTTTTTSPNRQKFNQILNEFGLDPADYIFDSSLELTSDFSSALPENLTQPQQLNIQLKSSARQHKHVQQPPPPPPVVNRQKSLSRSSSGMSQTDFSTHRAPPPPPPPPPPPAPTSSSFPQHDSDKYESNMTAQDYLQRIGTADNPPVKVVKQNTQDLVYRKEIRIRYLQPPTPPPPAPIIIREKQLPSAPPQSPLFIRERKPESSTPPPLTIRERPPSPPPLLEPYIIDKTLPPPPPQPRQVIIERLPTPPPKPRTVIFEKWLPYKKVKRPILLEKAPPQPPVPPTRNVIIEYEPLKAYTVRRVIEEGVFRVDPTQYSNYSAQTDGNVRIVDRIDDLPPPSDALMRILKEYSQNDVADYKTESLSNMEQLMQVSSSSSALPTNRERVLSSGPNRLIPSPVSAPFPFTQTRSSNNSSRRHTPLNSSTLNIDDAY